MVKSFLLFLKSDFNKYFHKSLVAKFGLCFDELGCFISFSYKILCKVGGLVSHIFLSIDSDLILSLCIFSLPG